MVAEAEVVFQHSLPAVLEIELFDRVSSAVKSPVSSPKLGFTQSVSASLSTSPLVVQGDCDPSVSDYVPTIRSGSFADIGPKRCMEDEHIRIDDLSSQVGCLFELPKPSAFYAVFDGHGGPEAAAYVRENAIRFFFEDEQFPQTSEVNSVYVEEVESSLRNAFLQADLALAEDCSISSSSGTTALTALICGRLLMVANAGDCRAVLCRKGKAIDMSEDHKPINLLERRRVEESGGFINNDGYLNEVLAVTRALGDWELKMPHGSQCPLISEPEIKQITLTEDDEFLVIGCDGIWDVMTSQEAVSIVKRGLKRHNDPTRCSRELVMEALRRNSFDNLTAVVVCFMTADRWEEPVVPMEKRRCFSLTPDAFRSLRNLLDG
ncbi:PREDICTED: probable protein phosphatase 2C 49 isoform X1 [Camelina sativa]|uniref:protein-serine/threonine phosphatase n=1 Tax=Camelina sativa TaxID=90675 RepID=A0ABM0WC73_CAMSA|nr:PREDICTED: probable protein phosphatase 2C 49 isoform X1 [Camelina sativa]